MKKLRFLLFGIFFGIVITKSEVISWFRIHDMFLFKEAHMYLIIGSAVIVGMISIIMIKRFHLRTMDGDPIVIDRKQFTKGTIIGGTIFGMGWAITGACPGPIFAQIGTGAYPAIFTMIGAVIGAYTYAVFRPRLPH